ncbi:hypothetical protein LCGC14_1438930 [marine sediment metagenome]|uniref:Uncharacterized protein n=1 Tax=marine sediment metagenome TaxID=412755 RepID=A0A0F9MN57_9ZZZZ
MIIRFGEGHFYLDENDRTWIDLISGIQNVPLGHGHKVIGDAFNSVLAKGVINAYDQITPSKFDLLYYLHDQYPDFKWAICSTGTESIERILQMVKVLRDSSWVGRILYVDGAFHGKSYAVARARYGDSWGSELFECLTPSNQNVPFDAIIYEPIQGLNGTEIDEMLLREIANKHGAYLIADEIITGFGRCGSPFLSKTADFIACGKGISSGVPIAFVASRRGMMDIPAGWTTTGSGNALCCEIAGRTLREVQKIPLSHIQQIEQTTIDIFGENNVLGKGAMLFIKVKDAEEARRRIIRIQTIALYTKGYIRIAPRLNFPIQAYKTHMLLLHSAIEDLL